MVSRIITYICSISFALLLISWTFYEIIRLNFRLEQEDENSILYLLAYLLKKQFLITSPSN